MSLQTWILASRPKTLPAAAAPVIIGAAMAWQAGLFHLGAALAALWGALWIQIGTNFANDYFDHLKGADTADRLGPTRVTSAGLASPGHMRIAIVTAFALAFAAGIYLVVRGGWPVVVIGLSSILFGILYTGGPYPLGYHGWGEVFVLVFFGPVAVAGTWYVQTLRFALEPVIVGLAPGLLSCAILIVNNLRDIDQDRVAGKKTLAVRFGRTFARIEYSACLALPLVVAILMLSKKSNLFWTIAPVVFAIPAGRLVRVIWTSTDGGALNRALAESGQLLFIFSLLFALAWSFQ